MMRQVRREHEAREAREKRQGHAGGESKAVGASGMRETALSNFRWVLTTDGQLGDEKATGNEEKKPN